MSDSHTLPALAPQGRSLYSFVYHGAGTQTQSGVLNPLSRFVAADNETHRVLFRSGLCWTLSTAGLWAKDGGPVAQYTMVNVVPTRLIF